MNPALVTIASDRRVQGLHDLRESAARHGWSFYDFIREWRGFPTKLIGVRDELPNLKRLGHTHVVFTDAYDTVAVGPPSAITDHLNEGMLISCEKACWPKAELSPFYEPCPTDWKYLNSGGYLADIDFLGDVILKGCDDARVLDDQLFMHEKYLSGIPKILLDQTCSVFQTVAHCFSFKHQHWSGIFENIDGRLKNKQTGTFPVLVHGNGRTPLGFLDEMGIK